MDHSLEQLLIDVHVARRERLVTDDLLRELFTSRPLFDAPSQRLGAWLEDRGIITSHDAEVLEKKGSAYHDALIAMGLSTDGGAADAEFDTLMEGSSIQPDSATPASSPSPTPAVQSREPSGIRYQKSKPHAEGGLGKVWLASDIELKRQVALKEIQPEHADDVACQLRFLQEAEITGSLEHPGIVPVYGLGRHGDGRPYYAMRFIEGQTLKEAIDELFRDAPSLPFREREWAVRFRRVLNRFLDVCNTVAYAHSRKVIHRDIKPGNIMLGAFGETLLVDWGLAKTLEKANAETDVGALAAPLSSVQSDAELTMQGTAVGTPAYMSPEQASGGRPIAVCEQSDVFSLGATLFHLLVGTPPTGRSDVGANPSHVASAVNLSPQQRRADVPIPLAAICQKAMAHLPADRYASANELAFDVENWLADLPVAAHPESKTERLRRWVRNHPTAVVTTAVASVLLILAALIAGAARNRYLLDIQQRQAEKQQLERSHLQQVIASVDAATASARAEIRNDRFEAALKFLDNAVTQLSTEPSLGSRLRVILQMQDRTRRLLDFTQTIEAAEELTFRDSSRRSSALLQRGLRAVGAFQQMEWWNSLPSQDLSPAQLHALRTKVYRAMFLLTALRLKETIPTDLNVTEMLKLGSAESKASNAASLLLCDLLDAYRSSQGTQLGRMFAEQRGEMLNRMLRGLAFQQPAIDWNPQNASDLYIMGTSLGYMVLSTNEQQRKSFETILGVRNAEATSRDMLTQASELKRDHYWTQLVRAFFEAARGEHQAASRSYSHTISLNPERWVGYSWLALSQRDHALSLPEDDPQRQTSLMQAVRNSERAVDLQPDARGAHTIRAEALAWLKKDLREAAASYLMALSFQEPLDGIHDEVVEAVDRWDLTRTLEWCHSGLKQYPESPTLHSCVAWAELILDNVEAAQEAATKVLDLDSDNRVGRWVLASVSREKELLDAANESFANLCEAHSDWHHAWYGYGQTAVSLGDLSLAKSCFERASQTSQTPWQALYAQRQLARLAIVTDGDDALQQVTKAIELAEIERLDLVLEAARQAEVKKAVLLLEDYHRSLEPITELEYASTPNEAPLLNGGFELGLTACWGDTLDKLDVPAWQRFGGSLATAAGVNDIRHSGVKSLRIQSLEDDEEDAFAQLSQPVPVVSGKRYRCTAWIRSENCINDAIRLMADDQTVVSIPSGSYGWQRVIGEFLASSDQLQFAVRCQGVADVWLDDITLSVIP